MTAADLAVGQLAVARCTFLAAPVSAMTTSASVLFKVALLTGKFLWYQYRGICKGFVQTFVIYLTSDCSLTY